MKKKYWFLIGIGVLVAVLVLVNMRASRERALPVQVEQVEGRDMAMIVSASGSIRPKRQVDISASSFGKITRVGVEEGELVRKGQFLLQIDPIELESTVARLEATLEAAKMNERQAYAQMRKSKLDLDRTRKLFDKGYLTDQEVETAETNHEIAKADHEAARHQIAQYEANLKSARHKLKEVTVMAEMDGIVTRLNVEEGESAIMGITNVPGTVLMTIADLSTIEVEVEVDETEVVNLNLGNRAKVVLDAFPDTSFAGEVTEIGNSPIISSSATSQQSVDFSVVVTIIDTIPDVRPGLSADAEITVAERDSTLSIPIQSLTMRRSKDLKNREKADSLKARESADEFEGVFVVEDGRASFREVEVGISSQKYFEVLSGLEKGDRIVTGNYRAIRDLKDGQRVKVSEEAGKD